MDIKEALLKAKNIGASDVHLSVGRPIMGRLDGKLTPIGDTMLMPRDTEALITPLLDEKQKKELAVKGEIDLALSLEGVGRFRLNVFKSRGSYAAALRMLPFKIPSPQDLGLPPAVINMTNKKRVFNIIQYKSKNIHIFSIRFTYCLITLSVLNLEP